MDKKVNFEGTGKHYVLVDEEKYYHMQHALKSLEVLEDVENGKVPVLSKEEYIKSVCDGSL